MSRSNLLILALAFGLACSGAAPAPLTGQDRADLGEKASSLRLAVAYFDLGGRHDAGALELSYVAGERGWGPIRPMLGLMANLDGALFGYGGLALPVDLPGGFRLTPSTAAGAYRQGGSVDLGSALEFRSGIQADREVGGWGRAALFFYHLSNAGLGRRNPGTEVLGVGWILP